LPWLFLADSRLTYPMKTEDKDEARGGKKFKAKK
jgi:hypothetical protein